ncbi:hypothetical protein J6895_01052 [Nakaseomyces glabratus]|nr:hypothetical protein J6895_01052 [Nakaseomyces glabratus]
MDISFERLNGLEAAKLIRDWLASTPGLRELVLVVKQFLHSRRLNNVHSGGLGGFSIICLVYSFLRMHPRIITAEIDPLENLGVLLIEFLNFTVRILGTMMLLLVCKMALRFIWRRGHGNHLNRIEDHSI